jgi:hypothetical protein
VSCVIRASRVIGLYLILPSSPFCCRGLNALRLLRFESSGGRLYHVRNIQVQKKVHKNAAHRKLTQGYRRHTLKVGNGHCIVDTVGLESTTFDQSPTFISGHSSSPSSDVDGLQQHFISIYYGTMAIRPIAFVPPPLKDKRKELSYTRYRIL